MPKKILPRKFWKTDLEVENISRDDFLKKLKIFGEQENIPNISWTGVTVLQFFLNLRKPKKVLEMGCANGFSSLVIAQELEQWNGQLLTGDVSEPSLESAKCNAEAFGVHNIEFRFGDILQTVDLEDGPFDLIFIDAQKSWTHKFFMFASGLLAGGGIIVVDDIKKFPEKTKTFWNMIEREKANWSYFLVPEMDDAMAIFTKKSK